MVLVPPQMTASLRTGGCAVESPPVPWNDLNVQAGGNLLTSARGAMESIYTALMTLEWMKSQSSGMQKQVWTRGPYGDDSLSLQSFFGGFDAERLQWATTALDRMIRALTSERRALRISVGDPLYNADRGVLTVKGAAADFVVDSLAATIGGSEGHKLADYIRNRLIASGTCIVTDSQMA